MNSNKTKGNIFQNVLSADVPQSQFDLSFENKLTCDMGELIPICCQEILPGDKFQCDANVFIRFQPLIAPIMHNIDVHVRWFFVPNRLVWNEFEDFITGGTTGMESPIYPYREYKESARLGSLEDYLGVPTETPEGLFGMHNIIVNMLPFRGYALIWNEYFRDQTLDTEMEIARGSGEDTKDYFLRRVRWEKDYFTSALPWTQRGEPVHMPPMTLREGLHPDMVIQDTIRIVDASGNTFSYPENPLYGNPYRLGHQSGVVTDPNEKPIFFDFSAYDSYTINQLREANAVQRFLERQAVGGARYAETLLNHFGVRTADSRLQRPEYLGGHRQPVTVSEVLQQSESSATSPQGNMAGRAISTGSFGSESTLFTEHGYLFGLMYVRPQTGYTNTFKKMLHQKADKFDYAWPEFASLGEQEILQKEVHVGTRTGLESNNVFGYQSRYAEYKFNNNEVHGSFKKDLSFWHLARLYFRDYDPALDATFVACEPRKDIFAVVSEDRNDSLLVEVYNKITAIRPLPAFGKPSL
ncbi:major capsid protein [Tortoise microvirus 106]|nr:major capsid protein [Tortoise microvirus 106]